MAACAGCGRHICRDCLHEAGGRAFCDACAAEAGAASETASLSPPPAWGVSTSIPPAGAASATGQGGPVGAGIVATCAFHPGVRAVTRCANCGALVCAGCRRVAGGQHFCEACYARRFPPGGDARRNGRVLSPLERVPWKLWPGLAFLPVPFVLSGLMLFLMRRGGDVSVGAAELLVSMLLYSSMVFFAVYVVSRYGNVPAEMGFNTRNMPSSLGTGFVGGALMFLASVAAGFFSNALFERFAGAERWLRGFSDINIKSSVTGIDLLIVGLVVVVAAPICEEIFFRGYLYPAMRGRMGAWGAAILNGFIFSAVHTSLFGLIGRTIAGTVLCLLYEHNDNLWSPITAHFINNFVAFFLPVLAFSTW